MAVKLSMLNGNRNIGIAFADASARMLGMSEFLDDEMFSNTEVRVMMPLLENAADPECSKQRRV